MVYNKIFNSPYGFLSIICTIFLVWITACNRISTRYNLDELSSLACQQSIQVVVNDEIKCDYCRNPPEFKNNAEKKEAESDQSEHIEICVAQSNPHFITIVEKEIQSIISHDKTAQKASILLDRAQQRSCVNLFDMFLALVESLLPFSSKEEHHKLQTTLKNITRCNMKALLDKLTASIKNNGTPALLNKLKFFINHHINHDNNNNLAFKKALFLVVEHLPVNEVNSLLSSIPHIYGSELSKFWETICQPLKENTHTAHTMLYRSLLRDTDSVEMIDSLANHIKHLPPDLRNSFLNQQIEDNKKIKESKKTQDGTYKCTALHFAIKNNNPFQVKALLELGVNPTIKDSSGKTPLNLAFKDDNTNGPVIVRGLLI